jgi:hypothetical protein
MRNYIKIKKHLFPLNLEKMWLVGKTFNFYLGYAGQGSDLNSTCPKMAVKLLE